MTEALTVWLFQRFKNGGIYQEQSLCSDSVDTCVNKISRSIFCHGSLIIASGSQLFPKT